MTVKQAGSSNAVVAGQGSLCVLLHAGRLRHCEQTFQQCTVFPC